MDGDRTETRDARVDEASKRPRRRWSAAEKAQIVREALKAGAVKQEVAQRHGVHVSVLARWRQELGTKVPTGKAARGAQVIGARLLPIKIRRSAQSLRRLAPAAFKNAGATQPGSIEVEFSGGRRLWLRGVVENETLRTVLQELSQS